MRVTPKISDKPTATRKSDDAEAKPLSVCARNAVIGSEHNEGHHQLENGFTGKLVNAFFIRAS
jgi:hypothetical protein